jgi:hypothetical protein
VLKGITKRRCGGLIVPARTEVVFEFEYGDTAYIAGTLSPVTTRWPSDFPGVAAHFLALD